MRPAWPSDPTRCRAIHIGDGESRDGPRLGGRAPAGVSPGGAGLRYLLTLPLLIEPPREVSIFVGGFEDLLRAAGVLNRPGIVQATAHEPSHRGERSELDGELSEHPIIVDGERDDWMTDDEGAPMVASFHKLGGRPYLVQRDQRLEADLSAISAAGFAQVLQLDFPSPPADTGVVDGDWPFGDGLFHLFGRAPFGPHDWRWFWQH